MVPIFRETAICQKQCRRCQLTSMAVDQVEGSHKLAIHEENTE